MQRINFFGKYFINPGLVLVGIVIYLILSLLKQPTLGIFIIYGTIFFGSFGLIKKTIIALSNKQFALDYLAILAIIVSLLSQEYLVAGIIALMIASGQSLEEYGIAQAKQSLTKLIDRIPSSILLATKGAAGSSTQIKDIKIGQEIFVRKGEVVPLDGILVSTSGLTDESSLTGEPYVIEKLAGDQIRSGTINIGEGLVVKVTKTEANSTYNKIIEMVKKAQVEKAPLVRLADKYSTFFTIITLIITAFAYLLAQSFDRVLAVLVIATPCPLILATPIALMGGVNAAAKKRIIVKKLSALEVLSRIHAIIFDKTGTITMGTPSLNKIEIISPSVSEKEILAISEAIERNSLHPLAKAIVTHARNNKVPQLHARNLREEIGIGIAAEVEGVAYRLAKVPEEGGMAIALTSGAKKLAIFHFEDEIKAQSKPIIANLKKLGLELFLFTGDKENAAKKVVESLGTNITIKAECSPADKKTGVENLKKQGKTTVMIGDGINDAPALALADVGIVFSNEEHTAASEAADIVFLGGDFSHVFTSIDIAKKTIRIARESILWGIGASIVGMILASFGLIPPILGAGLQEAIDVAVIINALRTSR